MASLTPEIDAFQQAQGFGQRQQMGQLQQMGMLQGILSKMREQKQLDSFRGALSQAKTPEEQAAVAVQFGTPQTILGHMDRQTTAANTKELGLQRLQQGAQTAMARLSIADRQATTAEQKTEIARGRAEIQN